MRPFTLLAYKTYSVSAGKILEMKKWYDEMCYAQANRRTLKNPVDTF